MKGRLPDFLIIGAMKSGTTSLHDYLGKHPDIFVSATKEIHYFADNAFNKYDIDWYKRHFVTDKKLAGTSPQNYTKCHNKYYKKIPERLKEYVPDVKMIYILRDPIERYRSHILENYFGEPKHDVEYNIETNHYEKTGLYFMQLQEYLKYFPLEQIHILTLEELSKDKLKTLNKIFDFLGVARMNDEALFDFVSNDHSVKILPRFIVSSRGYRVLNKLFPGIAQRLATSEILKRYVFTKGRKKYLSGKEIERLQKYYEKDVQELRKLTGLDFSDWSV